MQDLTLMQVHHRIADYHRMMDRVNGPGSAAMAPSTRRQGIRVIVARALVTLATRIAPQQPRRNVPTAA